MRFLKAGCASSVVQALVVQVWEECPLCGMLVVQNVVRMPVVLEVRYGKRDTRWMWFRSKHVMQSVIPDVRDPDRAPVVQV